MKKPENIFLLLGLIFGLGYVFLTPPFQSPDEDIHFMSAWQYSTLDKQNGFPRNLVESLYRFLDIALAKGDNYGYNLIKADTVGGAHKYTPEIRLDFAAQTAPEELELLEEFDTTLIPRLYWQYLVQMTAFKLAGFCSRHYLTWLFAGRLANLLFYLLVSYFAIRLARFWHWGMVILALTPMALSLAGSLSYDVSTNAFAFLAFALLQRVFVDEHKLCWRNLWPLMVLMALFILLKFPYVLIFGALFALPGKRFANVGMRLALGAFVLLCFVGGVWWNMERAQPDERNLSADARPFYDRDAYMSIGRADPEAQIQTLKAEPIKFLEAYAKTLLSVRTPFYAGSFIGILGWLTVWPPWWLLIIYGMAIFAITQFDGVGSEKFHISARIWFALCGIGIVTAVHMIFFLAVVPEEGIIAGVQGKYFIPVAPLFLLPLVNWKISNRYRETLKYILPIAVTLLIAIAHLTMLWNLYNHFWKI